jgi:hypothetical protein
VRGLNELSLAQSAHLRSGARRRAER